MTPAHRNLDSVGERSRHVSMRVPTELFQRLEALAADRNESVSQVARRLIDTGLKPVGRNTIDDAISALQSIRDQLPQASRLTGIDDTGDAVPPSAPKTIDILNAKTDLQHLITDVARGEEFVITHAGAPRARLVAVSNTRVPAGPIRKR